MGATPRRNAGLALAATFGLLAACSSPALSHVSARTSVDVAPGNPFRTGHTLIIPHGGGDGLFPENTIYAYEHSMALGGEVVDIDVSLSADGVLVAFHDATVERTTNGTGAVANMTMAQLAELDAGWGFERGGDHPFRDKGIGVPTLKQVLQRFPTTPTTLDVKDERVELAAPICALLRDLGRTRDVYIGTDGAAQVVGFRSACPEVNTSGTDEERKAMRTARDAGDTAFTTRQLVSQPSYKAADGTIRITKAFLDFSHSKGIAVLTWVVDDPKDMAALMALGVDGIYTRRPDLMIKL